jgi:hypothetical protein
MAAAQRPTSVTILAVINFVFGTIGLIQLLCGGVFIVYGPDMLKTMASQPQPGGAPNPFLAMQISMERLAAIPGYTSIMLATHLFNGFLTLLALVSGFGLLKMKTWGRWLCLLYAAGTILVTTAGTAYTITVVQPVMAEVAKEVEQQLKAKMPPGATVPSTNPLGGTGSAVVSVITAIFACIYAVAILIVLNRPEVRRAFIRAAGGVVTEPTEVDYLDSGPRFGRPRSEDERFQRPDE